MKSVIVTGSVGTGKTTLSRKLADRVKYRYIDGNGVILEYGLPEGYDSRRKSKIVDTNKLNRALIREISLAKSNGKANGLIIDSHLSHYLPKKYADLCIVTKCSLKILGRRLKKRRYGSGKIRENLDAEIFDVCLNEAKDNRHKILVIDTSKGINNKTISSIAKLLNKNGTK